MGNFGHDKYVYEYEDVSRRKTINTDEYNLCGDINYHNDSFDSDNVKSQKIKKRRKKVKIKSKFIVIGK